MSGTAVRALKRSEDVVVALIALVLLAPLLLALALAVRIWLGSPVLFVQARPGRGARPFRLLKFRTMREGTGADGAPLPDAQRLTRFGTMLRSTSLDELPEFINVLRGDLSLVGPRPLLMEYLPYYTPTEARRHEVRPGVTGLAQIKGRNALTWEERLALDVHYVDHGGFWLDQKILLSTLLTVIKREGITAQGHVTMPRFDEHRRTGRSGPQP